jgi:alkyl sulfatase BDS1-like metallo-beta-lactamase superfamily hydrolase
MLAQLSPEMLFDALAIRVDGPRAWNERLTVDVRITDADTRYRLSLANGVLTYSTAQRPDAADATVTVPRATSLAFLVGGAADPATLAAAGIELAGDTGVLGRLFAVLESPDPDFAIVTPTKE